MPITLTLLLLAAETGGPIGNSAAVAGQPMMLRATTVPFMRRWHVGLAVLFALLIL